MSETNQGTENLSNEEKIEFLKAMFGSLEIDEQAVFTNWCHEQVEKGGIKFLGSKIKETNEKMTNFIKKKFNEHNINLEVIKTIHIES